MFLLGRASGLLVVLTLGFTRPDTGWERPPRLLELPAADEALLRALVDEYFAAWAKRDVDAAAALWSADSPDLPGRRKTLQDLFAAHARIEVRVERVRAVAIEDAKASARVAVELGPVYAKPGQLAAGLGRLNRALSFVRQQAGWRIWRDAAAEEDLAAALVAAPAERRAALIAGKDDLVTAELWKALVRQATPQFWQGNYSRALETTDLAQEIARRIGDREGIAQALNDSGAIHYQLGDYELALDHMNRSLALRGDSGDRQKLAATLANIATVRSSQGNHSQAAVSYQKALSVFESMGYELGIATILNNLGTIHQLQRDYRLALENYERALEYFGKVKNDAAIAVLSNNIGSVHQREGRYDRALEYFRKSLALREAANNKAGIATTLVNIGEASRLQGRYDAALECLNRSLALYEELGDRGGTAVAFNNIAMVHSARGDSSGAVEFAERAAGICRQIGNRELLWEARTTAGKAYRALRRPVEARRALEEAIALAEALRVDVAGGERQQQRFFEGKVSPYHELIQLLVGEGRTGEAFTLAERAKARVLLDVLRGNRINIAKAVTADEGDRERGLNRQLVALNLQVRRESQSPQPDRVRLTDLSARLEKARLEYEAFQARLYASHPELRLQRGETPPLELEDAAGLLPDAASALLEYVVAGDAAYLFVLTRGGDGNGAPRADVYPIAASRADLLARAEAFRGALGRRDLSFRQEGRSLFDLLIAPARNQLQGKTSIIIVPDTVLWGLPFQALPTSTGRFLMEDCAISYAPSLTVLREMVKLRARGGTHAPATLLALGNPALGAGGAAGDLAGTVERLGPLPEAEREVRTLARLYGASRSRVYVGREAREDRLKAEAGSFSVLHLATHGIVDDASPMYSRVVLAHAAGAADEDGLLEAWELMKLDLKGALVVLSACDTANGRVGEGEGVIGLAWSLFVAGSPALVVSQWKVDAASTTELMVDFHRSLAAGARVSKGRGRPAQALRSAALKLMKSDRYGHPFYWAGFNVVGDGF
jgi:CHAT domain-containing protein/tetratricopeptide (TPR) repeat protein